MNTKARSGLLLCLLWLAGTGCSFHMTYLKPVEPPQFKSAAIRRDAHALVIFNEVIPGHPLPETIWDQSGPFWDAAHSHNIGFVQNYTDYIVALNIHSRQMIPFGRIFSDMITVATSNAFLRCDVAFSPQTAQSITNPPPDVQISINIDRFRVWESPMNNLNFSLDCHYQVIDRTKNTSTEYRLSRKAGPLYLGSMFHWDSYFIKQTERQTDLFTEQAVAEILQNCHF
ncbi:MAG TPA: hypothetical protein VN625_04985 [Desulfuromonadaceae bacterium]|nr:hypothetical protein [Desulfuromonadaceae bacterium]